MKTTRATITEHADAERARPAHALDGLDEALMKMSRPPRGASVAVLRRWAELQAAKRG